MPADKNLILFTNFNITTGSTSPSVDIGMGGTPVDHPLVARVFWTSAAATVTLQTIVQASYDNTNWRDVSTGLLVVGPNAEAGEGGVRFNTRRRYVRAALSGGAVNGITVAIFTASRTSPEMYLD
jgi:hypothetical protein